jgi:hypothetical protein
MNKFSNVLKIPTFSDLYKEMINKIAQKSKTVDPNLDVPMFSTSLDKKFEDLMMIDNPTTFGITALYEPNAYKIKSINELNERDEKFVLQLNVMAIFPQPLYDLTSLMCKKCQMSCSTKDVEDFSVDSKFTCKFCDSNEDGKLYYNVVMVCRENAYSNKLITLYLSSYDDEAVSFFGIPPTDFFRNSSEYQRIKEIINKLINPECYITVLIESIKTSNSETDRVYRIIGDYQNNFV